MYKANLLFDGLILPKLASDIDASHHDCKPRYTFFLKALLATGFFRALISDVGLFEAQGQVNGYQIDKQYSGKDASGAPLHAKGRTYSMIRPLFKNATYLDLEGQTQYNTAYSGARENFQIRESGWPPFLKFKEDCALYRALQMPPREFFEAATNFKVLNYADEIRFHIANGNFGAPVYVISDRSTLIPLTDTVTADGFSVGYASLSGFIRSSLNLSGVKQQIRVDEDWTVEDALRDIHRFGMNDEFYRNFIENKPHGFNTTDEIIYPAVDMAGKKGKFSGQNFSEAVAEVSAEVSQAKFSKLARIPVVERDGKS